MAQDDNFDWIFDFVMEVLKSPEWEVPVMSFIDTNCAVFDSEDENKLAYTDVHSSFRQVVDDVLTQKLAEVGVSAEDFAKACEVASEKRHTNRQVFDQLMAIDDFRVFKKMMVKRNMQLQLQAVEALKREQAEAAERAKAEAEAAEAARAEAEAAAQEDEAKQQDAARQKELEAAEQEQQALADAAAATLEEMELLQRQEEMEQRDLAAAIRDSLAMERDRQEELDRQRAREAKDLDLALDRSNEDAAADAAAVLAEEPVAGHGLKKRPPPVMATAPDTAAHNNTPVSTPTTGAPRKQSSEGPSAAQAKAQAKATAAATSSAKAQARRKPSPRLRPSQRCRKSRKPRRRPALGAAPRGRKVVVVHFHPALSHSVHRCPR